MYGRGYIAPDPLPPPPVKAMVPALELAKSLTLDAVRAALYCTTPCSRATVAAHLAAFGYAVDDAELVRWLQKVDGLEGFAHELPGVRKPIEMLCLRGQRV